MKTTDEMIKLFDTHHEMLSSMGARTRDFTPLVTALKGMLKQMKITRQVSKEVKEELGECTEEEFTKLAVQKLAPKLKELEKDNRKIDDMAINMLLFKLPDKKGKIFFELMKRMEEAAKIPFEDRSKREKIDEVMVDLEQYIEEINEVSKPFVPAPVDKNQTILFKVMFKYRKGNWRKIEMKATQTLEDLHEAIQDALEWDNDHLYSFYMDNKFYSKEPDVEYTCPYEPEGRKTADVQVGIFDLKKGQKFAYLFDFGDDHRFEIEVIGFGNIEKGKKYPMLVDSKGKLLEQYPEYDDE